MVITREFLAQYVFLEGAIRRLEKKIEHYEKSPIKATHGIVKGSRKGFPWSECHFEISGPEIKSDEERNKQVAQLLCDMYANKQLYKDMKLDIENFLEGIEDLDMKRIMELKYIERWTDEKIGEEVGLCRRAIGIRIDKFLEKQELE